MLFNNLINCVAELYGVDDGFRIEPDSSPHQQDQQDSSANRGNYRANDPQICNRLQPEIRIIDQLGKKIRVVRRFHLGKV